MNMNNKTRKSFKSAVNSFFSRLEHTGTRIKEVETTPKSFGRWEEPSSENDDFFLNTESQCYLLHTFNRDIFIIAFFIRKDTP
jgi:hypothetical protein